MQSRQRLVNNSGRDHRQASVNASLIVGTVSPLSNICFNFSNLKKKQIVRGQRNPRPGKILMSVSVMPYLFSASLDWCEILLGEIMSRWWFRRNPNCSKLTASCLPLIIPTQPEKDKKTKRRKKKRQKSIQQYKDTKCKVSTTYYSNSTRAGQKDKKNKTPIKAKILNDNKNKMRRIQRHKV